MVVYSIKDLEKLSGVKAHTLRIWEKRYDLIQPKRTSTNIRYYTDNDLRKLLNVCILYRKGYKISKIAKMESSELLEKVSNYSNLDLSFEDQLDALMLFILELDSYNFSKVLEQHISQEGLEETMKTIIYPLLDKLSLAWLAGSFSGIHESFVSQIIRSKILHSTEALGDNTNNSPAYIIYLPLGERHELSLLFLHFLLKKNKCKVINLGMEVNMQDIILAIDKCSPDYVFTILNEEPTQIPLQKYITKITENLGNAKLLVTGYQGATAKIDWPSNVIQLQNLDETMLFITSHK